ncbi:MAG TPA: hypothetical protein VKT19_06070, partial [Steroidobacteraceae bacterium]|nr:hypothetical protein [Steroidobacteraceae bacterium]
MSEPIRSIVVLRPNRRLGNTLLLMPLVQELQVRFPAAEITVVTGCGAAHSLFRGYERVSASQYVPAARLGQARQVLSNLRALRRAHFDLAIDPIERSRTGRFMLRHVQAR